MPSIHPTLHLHWRGRFIRPNAHLFVRHDAWRFMPPGSTRFVGEEGVKYFGSELENEQSPAADDSELENELEAEREKLFALKRELA